MPYIACEEENFFWKPEEVIEFDRLWQEGASIFEMQERFNRKPLDIAFLIIDRASKGKIKERENGLFGGWSNESS